MNRSFQRAGIAIADGRSIPAYQITCSRCGEIEKISANNNSGSLSPELAAARFRNMGWDVSPNGKKDICPKCRELAKPKQKTENVVQLKPSTVTVEPPREMSKEDKRLVFAKIHEVYLDEKSGYASGWSDKRVATDLGVPVAWIRTVREENFGEEGLNEDAKPLLDEARKILDAATTEANILAERLDQGAKARAEILKRADHLAGRITAMEKLFR